MFRKHFCRFSRREKEADEMFDYFDGRREITTRQARAGEKVAAWLLLLLLRRARFFDLQ
jgi:hypothetical protein